MPDPQDTIVAVATPPGRGAIGVVRISGPLARPVATALVGGLPEPRRASLRRFHNADAETIDEGLVIFFPAPASFTGEDLVELQCHGGNVVPAELVRAAVTHGARHARPGEFTERAFLNGKLDLVQAEAVADLIDSATTRAARSAYNSLSGTFSAAIDHLRERLVALRARVEASVDFPEEALEVPAANDLRQDIAELHAAICAMIAKARHGAALNAGLDLAIIGRPNVGKSTLLNRLVQRDAAIVSAASGTTRDVLSLDIEIEGLPVRIHDTAGIHDTGQEVEAEGVRRAMATMRRADVVLFMSVPGEDEDLLRVVTENMAAGASLIVLRNKIDLYGLSAGTATGAKGPTIHLCALSGDGLALLRTAIVQTTGVLASTETEFVARQRHVAALQLAATELVFHDAATFILEPEIAAERLRRAHHALGHITGQFTTEDLLGAIFERFCIGK